MDFIIEHYREVLIGALFLALFFKESLSSFINAKLGLKHKVEKEPAWASRLIQYTNHDTTERLEKLISMEEKEHENWDSLRASMGDISRTLSEFKEYGIKIRKE